ncbi:hypothetical protein ACFL5A_02045 [Gemmatimonadota bacterium]
MRSAKARLGSEGFTLIEVIGALVVFSVGVLMVLSLTGVVAMQMNAAGLRSMVNVAVQNKLDSLQLQPYDSLTVGSSTEDLVFMGETFIRTQTVLQATALVREVEVSVEPADGLGPNLTASSFVTRSW